MARRTGSVSDRELDELGYPPGAKAWGIEGPIVVQTIITADGEVTQPLVLKDLDAATLTYSALEALRHWKFRPARLDGEPVEVQYNSHRQTGTSGDDEVTGLTALGANSSAGVSA